MQSLVPIVAVAEVRSANKVHDGPDDDHAVVDESAGLLGNLCDPFVAVAGGIVSPDPPPDRLHRDDRSKGPVPGCVIPRRPGCGVNFTQPGASPFD